MVSVGELHPDGRRILYFELNGQPREIFIRDLSAKVSEKVRRKADPQNPGHLGATMPGKVLKVLVAAGDKVKKGEHLLISEAMKMETTIQAPANGKIAAVHVKAGDAIETGDLLIEME
jgi:pyruvate carboxylase